MTSGGDIYLTPGGSDNDVILPHGSGIKFGPTGGKLIDAASGDMDIEAGLLSLKTNTSTEVKIQKIV